jgi:penicillin amidase
MLVRRPIAGRAVRTGDVIICAMARQCGQNASPGEAPMVLAAGSPHRPPHHVARVRSKLARLTDVAGALERLFGTALLFGSLANDAFRTRRTVSLEERLAMLPRTNLPVERPVAIRWDHHQVPFIEAETDDDLAVALGIVHAHLRLGQLELMRRLGQGRVAAMIGASGIAIDHLLRTLDIGRAVPAIVADMPPATRAWIDAFVRGLNYHLMRVRPLPPEFRLLNLEPEPWTVTDVVTLGRLVSADVNWIIWLQLLKFRNDNDWPLLWHKLLAADGLSCWTNEVTGAAASLPKFAFHAGSNSFVVGPSRSATGGALIASDPHLSMGLPNAWLLAAFKSPSYQATGLMIPGLPFVALGRNPWIAWGGTNLHATSSDLVELPAEALTAATEREIALTVRWGRNRKIRIRETPWGPIITDVPRLSVSKQPLALRWMGHYPSDEITAMLAINRAQGWAEFQAALDGFAVPGQNMTFAAASGQIGRAMAARLPHRCGDSQHDIAVPPEFSNGWDAPISSRELPQMVDPAEAFVASANERPQEGSQFIGQHFSPRDRKRRLDQLLGGADQMSVEAAAQIQRDVHWESALAQCRQILAWLDSPTVSDLKLRYRRVIDALARWDGCYDTTSSGALALEILWYHLVRSLIPGRHRAVFGAAWGARGLLWDDVVAADHQQRQRALRRALRESARGTSNGETWGSRHRLRLGHPLAVLPAIGRAWRFTDLPSGGTTDTLMKTAHTLTNRRHGIRYGSIARHISDCSQPDRNYFVLLGGQDGWWGSTTFLDQLPLWQRGEYIVVPLQPQTACRTFQYTTDLTP